MYVHLERYMDAVGDPLRRSERPAKRTRRNEGSEHARNQIGHAELELVLGLGPQWMYVLMDALMY